MTAEAMTIRTPPPASLSTLTVFRHLRESRLFGVEQVESLEEHYAGKDPTELYRLLVEDGWLTPYQLRRISRGQPHGLVLGQYRILDELGEGGFGQVFRAVHAIMNREAALKVIAPHWVQDANIRELFLREVQATTRLAHPNIAIPYDANSHEGVLYLAMEYVEGMNLESLIRSRGPLSFSLAYVLLHQIAQALQQAHEFGIVHRDVKPANLMVAASADTIDRPGLASVPLVKIIDFGLARLYPRGSPDSRTIQQDGMIGTPEFMAPEQARDFHAVDVRADLYSLGCTFYFALTGKLPFKAASPLETVTRHLETAATPIERLRPDVPAPLATIIRCLMAKKPEQRYQTPADLAEAVSFAVLQSLATPERRAADVAAPTPVVQPAIDLPAGGDVDVHVDGPLANAGGAPLAEAFGEWMGAVDDLQSGRRTIEPRAYAELYSSLMRATRDAGHESDHAALARRIHDFTEPWLTTLAIDSLDRHSKKRLLETGRLLERELNPKRRSGSKGLIWAAIAIALLAVAGFFATRSPAVKKALRISAATGERGGVSPPRDSNPRGIIVLTERRGLSGG